MSQVSVFLFSNKFAYLTYFLFTGNVTLLREAVQCIKIYLEKQGSNVDGGKKKKSGRGSQEDDLDHHSDDDDDDRDDEVK